MRYGFGIDLGGTTVKLAFFEETGTMLHKWEIPTNTADSGKHILPDIAAAILSHLETAGVSKTNVMGIGIAVPGPVLPGGTVNKCINLGWGVFNIETTLSALTGLPVKAGNDANVAALGEYWQGGGKGYNSMVMVTLGTGVGGGVILDGKILTGAHGSAGEIGHMVLNREETVQCSCGKYGCVEQYCSATGIVRTAKAFLAATDAPSVLRAAPNFSCKDVFDAADAGDPVALEFLESFYARTAEFIANVCSVLNPEAVVIGGGVSKAGTCLTEGIGRHIGKYVFHAAAGVELALATLGNDAGAIGAFKLILDAA